jgi:hypothetical protein
MEELTNVLLTLDPKLVDEHVDAFLLDEYVYEIHHKPID